MHRESYPHPRTVLATGFSRYISFHKMCGLKDCLKYTRNNLESERWRESLKIGPRPNNCPLEKRLQEGGLFSRKAGTNFLHLCRFLSAYVHHGPVVSLGNNFQVYSVECVRVYTVSSSSSAILAQLYYFLLYTLLVSTICAPH